MRIATIILVAGLATTALPAAAAIIVIAPLLGTDPGAVAACAGAANAPTDRLCVSNGFLGNDFGSTAELQVLHSVAPGLPVRWPRFSIDDSRREIAHPGSQTPTFITFTPLAGYDVRMLSFDHRKRSATGTRPAYSLVDVATDTTVWSSTQITSGNGGFTTVNVGSDWFSNALRFSYNNSRGTLGINDIQVEIRPTPTGVIPEPANWAMMIAGFGMVGAVSRRRRAVARRRVAA